MSGEGTTPPHVELLSQSLQTLAVAFDSSFLEAPPLPCLLGGSSCSALAVIGTLVSSLVSSPARHLYRTDPSRSAVHVPTQQRSPPSSHSSMANPVVVALRRIPSWSGQRGLVAATHNQIRADHPA